MFQIKFCGITCVEDGLAAAEAGASAIGLNFYSKSPRYVAPELAAEIVASLPITVCPVGVFVDQSPAEIQSIIVRSRLEIAQLHGGQSLDFIRSLMTVPVMPAFGLKAGDESLIAEFVSRCGEDWLVGTLVDAAVPGEYGGTGATADWNAARKLANALAGFGDFVLAGGLTPSNVAEAITAVHPDAVDVASGIEVADDPTRKDHAKMRDFVQIALEAFDR